jgi:hypothetical protein
MEHFYHNIQGWFNFADLYSSAVHSFDKDHGTFVEVGTWLGQSLAFLGVETINSNKNIDLYSVDTWAGSIEHADMDVIKNNSLYEDFLNNIAPIKDRINVIRSTSLEASEKFDNESIDFLFLDASHEYEDVINDLHAWYPKIKKGAIFAGHDYDWSGVSRAVAEFCALKNLIPKPVSNSSWYFICE